MSNRTFLITGGSGKFGRSLLKHFLERGDKIIFTASSKKSVSEVAEDFVCYSEQLLGLEVDFTKMGFAKGLSQQLELQGIYPDGVVNNARSLKFLKIEDDGMVTRDNFLNEYLVDVVAPYELTMALAKQSGSRLRNVVNVGSMYGCVAANPGLYDDFERQSPIHYGVAKAALAHLTKELAVRLSTKKIRVNCVAYGGLEGRVDKAFQSRYASLVPMGRMLCERDIAGPIDYLLSDASSAMTGQVIVVDGGWSVW